MIGESLECPCGYTRPENTICTFVMFCFSSSAAAAAGLMSEMLGSGANQANLIIGKFN